MDAFKRVSEVWECTMATYDPVIVLYLLCITDICRFLPMHRYKSTPVDTLALTSNLGHHLRSVYFGSLKKSLEHTTSERFRRRGSGMTS